MSLYTLSITGQLPTVKIPAGLWITECTDLALLASLATTSIDEVRCRLANDHVAFVAYMHNQPAAFGWMARGKASIGELNHELILPGSNRYLWNFRTLEPFRGLGIYPALLQYIIRYEAVSAERFWIIHAPENHSSLSGIVKAGFTYVGKLYTIAGGCTSIEATAVAKAYRELLHYMDIELSEQAAASCWNCSSPYLKKRKPGCCCATTNTECIGNSMLSMAS